MNRNAVIAVAIISLLVIGGLAYVVVPAMFPANSMTVTFYDTDDNIVDSTSTELSLWPFAYIDAAGQEVTKVVVTVDYDTQFEGTPTSVNVICDLTYEVRLDTIQAGLVNGPYTDRLTKTTESGTFTYTFYLNNLVTPVESAGMIYGWGLTFIAELTGSAIIDGQTVAATSWSDGIHSRVDWSTPTLSMIFVSTVIDGTLVP